MDEGKVKIAPRFTHLSADRLILVALHVLAAIETASFAFTYISHVASDRSNLWSQHQHIAKPCATWTMRTTLAETVIFPSVRQACEKLRLCVVSRSWRSVEKGVVETNIRLGYICKDQVSRVLTKIS